MTRTEPLDSNYYAKRIADFVLLEHQESNPGYEQLFYTPTSEDQEPEDEKPNRARKILDGMLRDYKAAVTRELILRTPG